MNNNDDDLLGFLTTIGVHTHTHPIQNLKQNGYQHLCQFLLAPPTLTDLSRYGFPDTACTTIIRSIDYIHTLQPSAPHLHTPSYALFSSHMQYSIPRGRSKSHEMLLVSIDTNRRYSRSLTRTLSTENALGSVEEDDNDSKIPLRHTQTTVYKHITHPTRVMQSGLNRSTLDRSVMERQGGGGGDSGGLDKSLMDGYGGTDKNQLESVVDGDVDRGGEKSVKPTTTVILRSDANKERRRSIQCSSSRKLIGKKDKEPEEQKVEAIKVDKWFLNITGCSEDDLKLKRAKVIRSNFDSSLVIRNQVTNVEYKAGICKMLSFSALIRQCCFTEFALPKSKRKERQKEAKIIAQGLNNTTTKRTKNQGSGRSYVEFVIITRKENDDPGAVRFVDVAYLQSLPENRNAVFQVASNFNGIEAQSELVKPEITGFTEKYFTDRTQGPAASISAGAGAIVRVHAAFYNPNEDPVNWSQTEARQLNFLENLKEHYPVRNGYVIFAGDEPKFPKVNSPEYQKLLLSTQLCYHKDQQITTGHRIGQEVELCKESDQTVDQVMCAAVNIFQGRTGNENARAPFIEAKCRLVLDVAYQGTYLAAIANHRSQIFLTLVGGGIFGNKKEWIYDAIISAHLKWGIKGRSTLTRVSLVAFNPRDLEKSFLKRLEDEGIPVKYEAYEGLPMEED